MTCRVFAAHALWLLGYPDQALQRIQEALTLARELSHPLSLVFALTFAAWIHAYRREVHLTQERAEEAITLGTEQGFGAFWLVQGHVWQGWALAEQGQKGEGISQMRQGIAAFRDVGVELKRHQWFALLAGVYEEMGQAEEGLNALAEALAAANKTGERWWEAELYRLKGQLTLQQFQVSGPQVHVSNPQHPTPRTRAEAEAEACFHKAIEIARRQSAKSPELRAAVSLSQLWQQQDKQREEHNLLGEISGWFTEGFDTKDLQEAKALLDELAV